MFGLVINFQFTSLSYENISLIGLYSECARIDYWYRQIKFFHHKTRDSFVQPSVSV